MRTPCAPGLIVCTGCVRSVRMSPKEHTQRVAGWSAAGFLEGVRDLRGLGGDAIPRGGSRRHYARLRRGLGVDSGGSIPASGPVRVPPVPADLPEVRVHAPKTRPANRDVEVSAVWPFRRHRGRRRVAALRPDEQVRSRAHGGGGRAERSKMASQSDSRRRASNLMSPAFTPRSIRRRRYFSAAPCTGHTRSGASWPCWRAWR